MQTKPTWKELLARDEPLLLPCAYDALSARLIERAGFAAYSVGGYALVGARHALPDIGLVGFGEMSAGIRDIMAATSLPVLVDCDDGYGDVKNVARTIEAALADLKTGRPAGKNECVDFEAFKDIVSMARWADVEQRTAPSRK